MTQKALYLCCIAEPWIDVAKHLESKGVIPVYFVHWEADEKAFLKAFNETCYLQTVERAWKGLGFPQKLKPKALDEPEHKKIAWYELNALKMMDRLDPLGNHFSFQERRYFFQDLVGYWLACIDRFDIDVVISPSIPHRIFDYSLYVACKIKNVRFLMFQMVPFGSTSLIIEDIDTMGEEYVFNVQEDCSRQPSNIINEKIAKTQKDYSQAVPSYMVDHEKNQKITFEKIRKIFFKPVANTFIYSFLRKKKPNTYWVKKGCMPENSDYSWLSYYITSFLRALKVGLLKKKYGKLVSKPMPDNFILLALHYQPEETSCPTGGSYADQINILKVLDEVLPEDIWIIVKEHKSQFYTHQESASGRDASFYKRLKSISYRVKFSSVDATPFDLIDNALATVTISGTIGWESAIRGTPTLVFGRAWYENMPRVHKIKSKKDLLRVIPFLEQEKNADLQALIMSYHSEIEKKIIKAKHYKAFLKNSDIDIKDSKANLVNALSDRLLATK